MISRLNQLPTLFSFSTKKILQPINASLKSIMNKAEAILITVNRRLSIPGLWFWEFMDRHLIFPLSHTLSFLHGFLSISIEYITTGVIKKSEIRISKLSFVRSKVLGVRSKTPCAFRFTLSRVYEFRASNLEFLLTKFQERPLFKLHTSKLVLIRWWHRYCLWSLYR